MPTVTGVVEKVWEKGGRYSLVIDGEWYSTYTNKPACNEGDNISMDYVQKGKFKNADASTIEVQEKGADTVRVESGGPDRQAIIQYQGARNTAVEFLQLAHDAGAIKLPAKQEAKYDALLGLFYELTDKFNDEASTLGPVDMPDVDNNGKYGDE